MDHCNREKRKINPREEANVLSLFTFGYTLGLFKKGIQKDLEEEDLYEVIEKCRSKKCGNRTEKQWNKCRSIYKLLWKRFGFQYITLCLVSIAWHEIYSIFQPSAMSRLISYFEKGQTNISQSEAYHCAGLVAFFTVFSFIFVQNLLMFECKFSLQIRTSLKSLLYRKALKLSPASFSETNLGNIVTILTKDINTLENDLWLAMNLVILIIQTLTIAYLLWAKMGDASFIALGLLAVVLPIQSNIFQPSAMSRLISYFEKGQTNISQSEAYHCAGLVAFFTVFSFLFVQNLLMFECRFSLQIRTSLKSLLYRKALKLSPGSFSETNLGNIVTILTKDIHTLEKDLWLAMDLVIHIIQSLTIAYLLWAKMGDASFIGLGLLAVVLPIQTYLSTLLMKMNLMVGKNTDERLQVTQETLSVIKIIKMYTWENFFNKKISAVRKAEMTIMMKALFINFFVAGIGIFTSKLTFLVLILSYIWMGYTTSTEMIFYILGLFNQLTWSLGILIPYNICKIADFRAAFTRFNKLLQAEEIINTEENLNGKTSIVLKDVTVSIKDNEVLTDISLIINEPGLTLITGAVGSGKSSLLKAILQDYSRSKGELEVQGTVSYASQDPWLFPSSIKQNILFGQKYDANRYEEVIRVCALKYDLALLEHGDETVVADRGLNLSKGQQSRINLARAIYKDSDIYLLDDSLTSLDGKVQDFIFHQCIQQFLNDKTCILVTQNTSHLEEADNVIVMDRGKIILSGKPAEVFKKKVNGITQTHENETKISNIHELPEKLAKAEFLLETEQFTKKKVYHETKKVGKVELSVYKKYYQYGGGIFVFSCILSVCIMTQICESVSDTLLTNWIDLQQTVLDLKANSSINETFFGDTVTRKENTFVAYTILVVLKVVLMLIKWYALLIFCRNASINIHQVMSSRVVNAAMSFFDTHFIGNILNRFSHDMSNIDEDFPHLFPALIRLILNCTGGIIIISTVNWYFLIPASVLFIILFLLRLAYMPTGRSLKRLEAATRSPLVGHINSSLEGLTTIRAFKAEQILKDEFDRHQDLYTSAYFTLFTTNTAFGFFMDMFCSAFTIVVIVRFLFFPHDLSAGNVGLALTQVCLLTQQIQYAIKQWAELENLMTSVERTLEYTTIKQENYSGAELTHWPSEGSIMYEEVTLKYENSRDPVLRNINFSVLPKQKIGIVGRTGAGKSSIISTLFRLYEFEGKIIIDGVDIQSLSLDTLRRSIAIIPQDPILFTGTIRDNLDPNRIYTDEEIWKVIEQVKIKDLVPSLEFEVKESGSSFSAGQKQLICVARAALGKHKIVVLDEATANMDVVTDKMLHGVIENIFANCTILTIAHRLSSIINCDMVVVLDKGQLIEFDNPRKLLQNKFSHFYKMCRETEMEH